MLEKENLTPFQIQLLLYYLTAEPSKRTVTDSARSLNVSKWVVTRTLVYGDNVFEKCGINRDGAGEVGKPRYFNGKRHF